MHDHDSLNFSYHHILLWSHLIILITMLNLWLVDPPTLIHERLVCKISSSDSVEEDGREDETNEFNDTHDDSLKRVRWGLVILVNSIRKKMIQWKRYFLYRGTDSIEITIHGDWELVETTVSNGLVKFCRKDISTICRDRRVSNIV